MKRFIAAVSFAVLAVPAFAAEMGAPFEQTELDRALPSISGENVRFAAVGGDTASDASVGSEPTGYVWANDHNFISPAP
jgi:hypothetical protein